MRAILQREYGTPASLTLTDIDRPEPGQTVIGASGGVGSFAVQIAKALGAEVTGVCSTGSVDTVRGLGADHVVDYTREDFRTDGHRCAVIFQLAGTQSARELRGSLTEEGTRVLSSGEGGPWIGPIGRIVEAAVTSPFVPQRSRACYATPHCEHLLALTKLIDLGQVTPLIDRTYPLSDAAEAVHSAAEDHVRGKIVVTM